MISTHALTWSATKELLSLSSSKTFQLTHSRGVRLKLNTRLKDFKYFNSRTHVECDDWDWWVKSSPQHFNSRTHVECDFQSDVCYKLGIDFNSRTHVECDQYHQMKNVDMIFQLTHSRGVRLASVQDFKNHFSFQLTHSRGVRHNSLLASSVFRTISTHALTWSATFNTVEPKIYLFISTHALTWSATRYVVLLDTIYQFQLTHSRGVRPMIFWVSETISAFQLTHSRGVRHPFRKIPFLYQISTHALTWSATVNPLGRLAS